MKQLRKSPKIKQILWEEICVSDRYSSTSLNNKLRMNVLEGRGYSVWGFDSVLLLVPDMYRELWDNGGKEEWTHLYRTITDVWNDVVKKQIQSKKINVYFIGIVIPNGAIELKQINIHANDIEIGTESINRGFTRYMKYENGILNIRSVMFHPSSHIGVVAFHELMHAIMFATGHFTEKYIDTPWGPSPLNEIICEFYGNCMNAYKCISKTKRRTHLLERMKVYETQAKELVYLMNYRNTQMGNMNPISYLCGTFFSLRKLLEQNRISWSHLLDDPIRFLDNPYLKPTSIDWNTLNKESKQVYRTNIRFDRS